MAGTLWMNGPQPDGGDVFCTLCSMLYKGAANLTEAVQELQNQVNSLPEGQSRDISILAKAGTYLPGRSQPEHAVSVFINTQLQQIVGALMGLPPGMVAPPVPVPLCWTHLMGLQLKPGGAIQPATADQMPAGMPPGAVDLSRRRGG